MPRSPRALFPDAIYHVISRGNERCEIYRSDRDYSKFLKMLGEVVIRYNLIAHAYCLMPNHYHLVLETPDANLSRAMQQLNGDYGRSHNRAHGRVGHLFQGRFKAVLVERQTHLLELTRYVVLNPVRSRLVDDPQEWPWSSFRATVGMSRIPEFLRIGWTLKCFNDDLFKARLQYLDFVMQGICGKEEHVKHLGGTPVLGGPNLVARYKEIIGQSRSLLRELPKKIRFAGRPALSSVLAQVDNRLDRNRKIREAHISYGYTLSEIARHLGMHRSSISRVIGKIKMRQFTV